MRRWVIPMLLISVLGLVAAANQTPSVTQDADGVITFTPPQPGSDTPRWSHRTTRTGRYDVVIDVERGDRDKVELTFTLAGQSQRARHGDRIDIAREGELAVTIASNHADVVSRITLRPAPEGEPITQAPDRSIMLHARDATVHGTRLRYERDPKKNTLGYWTQPTDWASWDFTVKQGGEFIVFAMQGAPGGGSTVAVTCANQTLDWTVADTGSFHTFTFLELGRITIEEPGNHTLAVKPKTKSGVAIMDLRQIVLVPVLP